MVLFLAPLIFMFYFRDIFSHLYIGKNFFDDVYVSETDRYDAT